MDTLTNPNPTLNLTDLSSAIPAAPGLHLATLPLHIATLCYTLLHPCYTLTAARICCNSRGHRHFRSLASPPMLHLRNRAAIFCHVICCNLSPVLYLRHSRQNLDRRYM